jgi:transposase-like protein
MARAHDAKLKAAVLAEIATGASAAEAARLHGVGKTTAAKWAGQGDVPRPIAPTDVEIVPTDANAVRTLKKADLGVQLYDYLSESIATLQSQVVFARDRAWLEKQSADSLAILHGVIADKATRLLAAIQPRGTEAEQSASD